MSLTADGRERLCVWSAGVMEMTTWHHPRSGRLLGFTDGNGDRWWLDDSDLTMPDGERVWNPLVSLDQAVLVANKARYHWVLRTGDGDKLYCATCWRNGIEGFAQADEPAEALIMACADAVVEKWRDG